MAHWIAWLILTSPSPPADWLTKLPGVEAEFVAICRALDLVEIRPPVQPWEVRYARDLYQELRHAPFVIEAERFQVPRDWLLGQIRFNREVRDGYRLRAETFPREQQLAGDIAAECQRLWVVYDSLADAKSAYYSLTVRRRALQRVRDNLDAEDWRAGRLPPCVPIWAFREIK